MKRKVDELVKMTDLTGNVVSLYQSTTRIGDRKDILVYKGLLKEGGDIIARNPSDLDEQTLDMLQKLQSDREFWQHRTEGLAIFAKGEHYVSFDLRRSVQNSISVAKVPFLLPMIEAEQVIKRHFLLDLSRDRFELWYSDGVKLAPIEEDVAKSFDELFDVPDSNSYLNFGSYRGKVPTFYGYRAKPEEDEKDKEKYFRYLDGQLSAYFEKYGIKVLLGGTAKNIADWKRSAKSPYYMERDLGKPISDFADQELMSATYELFETDFEQEVFHKLDSTWAAQEDGRASKNLTVIDRELGDYNVEDLLVGYHYCDHRTEEIDRLVFDALRTGSNVIVIPRKFDQHKELIAARFKH